MTREEMVEILMYLSKLKGFARGTHKNEMLPDDMWDEMVRVTDILLKGIKEDT